jgi:hypothetical protein
MVELLLCLKVCGQMTNHEFIANGLRYQEQADSIQRLIEAQTLAFPAATEAGKEKLRMAIRDHEALVVALQKKANGCFIQAAVFEKRPASATTTEPMFAILSKPAYSAAKPVPIDDPLPDGVVYKIQLGAYVKPVTANFFKGLTPLSGETLDNGIIKYYTGFFRRYMDADVALRKVHEYGFRDAYIVAFYNRKAIHIGRAKQLETGY